MIEQSRRAGKISRRNGQDQSPMELAGWPPDQISCNQSILDTYDEKGRDSCSHGFSQLLLTGYGALLASPEQPRETTLSVRPSVGETCERRLGFRLQGGSPI
ncbi:hypothetical protein CLAIMM_03477, partial [Cladophialophora immunda]